MFKWVNNSESVTYGHYELFSKHSIARRLCKFMALQMRAILVITAACILVYQYIILVLYNYAFYACYAFMVSLWYIILVISHIMLSLW